MVQNSRDSVVMAFIRSLKDDAFVQKNLYTNTWRVGSTEVYPVTIWPQGQINLQWKSNRPCNKFIQDTINKHSDLLQYGYFDKSDGSCPSQIVFKVIGSPLMNKAKQLTYMGIPGAFFEMKDIVLFVVGDVVVAKQQYLDKNEKEEDTLGIVVDYKPENDYLSIGVLHPENYAFPPISSAKGAYYRLVTPSEKKKWNII